MYLVTQTDALSNTATIIKIRNLYSDKQMSIQPQRHEYRVKQEDIFLAPSQPTVVQQKPKETLMEPASQFRLPENPAYRRYPLLSKPSTPRLSRTSHTIPPGIWFVTEEEAEEHEDKQEEEREEEQEEEQEVPPAPEEQEQEAWQEQQEELENLPAQHPQEIVYNWLEHLQPHEQDDDLDLEHLPPQEAEEEEEEQQQQQQQEVLIHPPEEQVQRPPLQEQEPLPLLEQEVQGEEGDDEYSGEEGHHEDDEGVEEEVQIPPHLLPLDQHRQPLKHDIISYYRSDLGDWVTAKVVSAQTGTQYYYNVEHSGRVLPRRDGVYLLPPTPERRYHWTLLRPGPRSKSSTGGRPPKAAGPSEDLARGRVLEQLRAPEERQQSRQVSREQSRERSREQSWEQPCQVTPEVSPEHREEVQGAHSLHVTPNQHLQTGEVHYVPRMPDFQDDHDHEQRKKKWNKTYQQKYCSIFLLPAQEYMRHGLAVASANNADYAYVESKKKKKFNFFKQE